MSNHAHDLHVLQVLEGTAGGARKHLRYIATGLRQAGATVDLAFSTRLADPDFQDDLDLYQRLGCQVHLIDMHKRLDLSDWRAMKQLRSLIAERQPDIVHTHCAKAGLLGRLAAAGRCRVVHTPHSYFFEGFHNCLFTRLGVGLERWLNRRTDLLFCISEAERTLIERHRLMPAKRVIVGPNGLPADFELRLLPRQTIRRELGIPDGAVAIGVFARMVRKKGHAWFLDAIAAMDAAARSHTRVLFFGDGPLVEAVEQRIERLGLRETVIYRGYKPAAERYLPGMDLAVLPSFYEGLSYQLLEALGAGLPLIATDIPGNRFDHPANPILYVEPGNSQALARQLNTLVRTKKVRTGLGEQSRKWVRWHFSLDRQVNQLTKAYLQLLEREP